MQSTHKHTHSARLSWQIAGLAVLALTALCLILLKWGTLLHAAGNPEKIDSSRELQLPLKAQGNNVSFDDGWLRQDPRRPGAPGGAQTGGSNVYEGLTPPTAPPPVRTGLAAACPPGLAWEMRAGFTDPRTSTGIEGAAANLIGGKIYVSHGYRGSDGNLLSIYDLATNTWTHGGASAPNAAVARSEMAGGTALGKHYAIGGRTGPNATNEEFDPGSGAWMAKAPMPLGARGGLGAASFGNKIYAVGGRTGATFGGGTILNRNEVYDPATNAWTTLATLPTAVSDNYATVAFGGKIYVFGGATSPSVVIGAVQIYDIASNTWSAGAAMPTARAAAMAGVIGSQIAVFGGYNGSANLTTTEIYDPATNSWCTGPNMLLAVSEISQGMTSNGSEVYSVGTGIFGVSGMIVQRLVQDCTITCPASFQLSATSASGRTVTYPAPTTTGNCGTVTCSPASGSNFPLGTTTVTCATAAGPSCSFTVTVNRVSSTIADPLLCTKPGAAVTATLTITNNGAAATTVDSTSALPAGLLALPGTCATNVGSCTVANAATVNYSGTLAAGQTATITYLAQVADGAPVGTQLCANTTLRFGGGPPSTVQACITVTCQAVGPGSSYPAASQVSDQKAGSVLIYNVYTSSAASPNTQNTRINLTNTNPSLPACVHLFLVDGASCSVADFFVCLTPNQTMSFLASDLDPGTTGYIVAVASDCVTGCPVDCNFLIGDEYVKFASGHAANLGAEAISAIAGGLPFCNANSATATLAFDGVSYNAVPRVLALDNIGSRADGNDTLLILNRIGGNLGTGAATLTGLFGLLYDDAEVPLSFGFSPGVCQFRSSISNSFPRTTPRLETFIPSGQTGWMKLYSQNDQGILGAAIRFNSGAAAVSGAFNQGHNLHKLTLTTSAIYTIPIFPPNC